MGTRVVRRSGKIQAPTCGEFHVFVAGTGCDPSRLRGAAGRYVVADRGSCSFAEKSYVAAAAGGAGLVVLETDTHATARSAPAADEAFLKRHPAAAAVPAVFVGAPGASGARADNTVPSGNACALCARGP